MELTIRVEWDMGHRLPNHGGQCRNLHGHRYVAEVTLNGPVKSARGDADEGMLIDFGPAKELVRLHLQDRDHRFLISHTDPLLQDMERLPGVIVVPYVPTAENMAADLLAQLRKDAAALRAFNGVAISKLRLYETPTSWAEAS